MIIGEVLHAEANVSEPVAAVYFSPWMPRGGNLARVACEVFHALDLNSFEITVQTKNSEDADKDATIPAGGSANSVSLAPETVTSFSVGAALSSGDAGFKELFRYKFSLTGETGAVEAVPLDIGWVHFRMLNPAWLSN